LRLPTTSKLREPTPGLPFYEQQLAKSADEVIASMTKVGGIAAAQEVDFAEADIAPRLFDWAEAKFGPVDILINNAAHYETKGG
jgi:3-oxoacyl-[acyl-carrier protein] reductase